MDRTRLVFVLIILGALCIAGLGLAVQFIGSRSEQPTPLVADTPPPAGAVVVEIHSSNTNWRARFSPSSGALAATCG